MSIEGPLSQFLARNGVPPRGASSVAARIAAKTGKRQPMTPDETALARAFLARPGANAAAERHAGLAILTANKRAAPAAAPGARDIPVVPNAGPLGFSNVLVGGASAPGAAGTPAEIRRLAEAISRQPG